MNSKGFTLPEMMTALFIGAFILLGGSLFYLSVVQTDAFARHSADSRANAQGFLWAMDNYLAQALNVQWTNSNINNIGTGPGQLRQFASTLSSSAFSPPETIGVFLRESGVVTATVPGSDLRATGLYFKNPTATTPGYFYIASSMAGVGNAILSPANPIQYFNNIVEFEIAPAGTGVNMGDAVKVARIRVVFRKFFTQDATKWRFCPSEMSASNAACIMPDGERFVDSEHVSYVVLPNNITTNNYEMDVGGFQTDSVYGRIYLFKPGK